MTRGALLLCLSLAGCSGDDDDDAAPADWQGVYDPLADDWLLSSWGSGRDDVWMVGGSEDRARAIHFDGDTFHSVETGGTATLWWVWGSGDGTLIMVGERCTVLRSDDDGRTFTTRDCPEPEAKLWGVWAASPDDVWIVGEVPVEGEVPHGLVLHAVDDGPLEPVDPLGDGEPLRPIFKAWGSGPDDLWLVGDTGTVLHWDGDAWARQDVGTLAKLLTVSGCGPGDVWIVGGLGNGVALHLEDGAWVDWSPPFATFLNGVHCRADAVWVVGVRGWAGRFNGDGWDEFAPTALDLHGVWSAGPDFAFAVGGNLIIGEGANREGALLHYGSTVLEAPVL